MTFLSTRMFLLLSVAYLFTNQKGYTQTQQIKNEQLRLQRLETVADIWSRLYLGHPAVFTNQLNFETVLMDAIPAVENAASTEEFVKALNEKLFYPLNDPLAFAQVVDPDNEERLTPAVSAGIRRIAPNVMMLDATDQRVYSERNIINRMNDLLKGVRPRDTLIVDLRWRTSQPVYYHPGLWLRLFANSSLRTGFRVSRQMVHRSDQMLNPESSIWGFSNQSFKVEQAKNLRPLKDSENEPGWVEEYDPINFDSLVTTTNPVYFIVNNSSYTSITHTLDGLQGQDNIRILWSKTGNLPRRDSGSEYPESIRINLGCNMLVSRTGHAGTLPDVIYAVSVSESQLLNDMRKGIARKTRNAGTKQFTFNITAPLIQKSVDSLSKKERITGLIKIWMLVSYFFPHLENSTMDWKHMLPEWIPKVEKSETLEDYVLTLQKLLAGLNDSHFGVWSNGSSYKLGRYLPPIRLKKIQGKVIVTEIENDSLRNVVEIGDEIKSLDDKSIDTVTKYWREIYSASSDQAFNRWLWNSPLGVATRGEQDSSLKLKLIHNGKQKDVNVRRSLRIPWASKDSEMSKSMPDNIGYIRHYAIPTEAMRDSLIDAYADTDGLIIDLRGRPRISVFPLATFFSNTPVAREKFEEPFVSFVDGQLLTGTLQLPQAYLSPDPKRQYSKPVVVLIDANMQSHSESAAIILRNTGNVTLVGSPTTGTTGRAIPLSINSKVTIGYTSDKVSNTDGSKFQNIGVVPDVFVEPTILGIKQGRDEVLEKGMVVVKQKISERNKLDKF